MACPVLQTYMLKLAKSGEDGEKTFLVLESGSRFHTTQVCTMSVCLTASIVLVKQQHKIFKHSL